MSSNNLGGEGAAVRIKVYLEMEPELENMKQKKRNQNSIFEISEPEPVAKL